MKTPRDHPCDLYKGTCKEVIDCDGSDKCEREDCEHRDPHVRDTLTDPCDFECIDAVQRSKPVECVPIEEPAEPDKDALGLAALFDHEPEELYICSKADVCNSDQCELMFAHRMDGNLRIACNTICHHNKLAKCVVTGKPKELIEEEPTLALEHILLTMWEGDTSDLNMIRIAKKEMMYEEVIRWLIAGLNEGCIDDEKYRVQEIIVYDKADLDGWLDKVEKALKKLAEL